MEKQIEKQINILTDNQFILEKRIKELEQKLDNIETLELEQTERL